MESIEALLSHDDYYWITRHIRKAQKVPGTPADVDTRARDILTLWAGVIRDYASRDYYELVQGYYRPRVTTYLKTLRRALNLGQRMLYNPTELEREYDAIEKKWVREGFPLVDRQPDPKQVITTVHNILARFGPPRRIQA